MLIRDLNKSRSESVYEYIKAKIIYGEYEAGMLLKEGEFADLLKVSKTPVREAFQGLKHEGLLEVIPYKGYIVTSQSFSDLNDLFELRIILEVAAAEFAIERVAPEQLKQFKRLATQHLVATEPEEARKEFLKVNAEFHNYLGVVTGNKELAKQIEKTNQKLQRGLFVASKKSSLEKLLEEHIDLVHAIERKDLKSAKEIIIHHVEESRNNVMNKR